MKKSYKILIVFALVAALGITYRAPVVEAKIQAIKQLLIDLANGNVSVQASSTAAGAVETAMLESGLQPSHVVKYAGTALWSTTSSTQSVAVIGLLTSDVLTASISSASTEPAYLESATVLSNNSAIFTLSTTSYDAEVNYSALRAAP